MASENTEERRLAAIMFTDMLGYSALSQRNEALALALLAESQSLLRRQFSLFNGREVKNTGDGFLVEFSSALQATQCAVEIQRALKTRNAAEPAERHFQIRIGLHVGDVVHRANDIYGDGVNIAARIEPLAVGGGICLSDAIFAQVQNKLGLKLDKLEAPKLKHIEVPMDVYRVVLPWENGAKEFKTGPGAARVRRLPSRRLALAGALLLLLAGGGWWLAHRGAKAAPAAPDGAVEAIDQKSIAVLPFINLSADKTDEYLSDGMTEELLNVLAQVKGLRVPGRSSSFAFKGKTEEDIFQKVGAQLHVATVLEGSVRKAGDKLRVTAQLINVGDGFHLWSEDYDGSMGDILNFQSEVAQRVVQALQGQLGIEEARTLAKKPTENPEAYRLYLLGRSYFAQVSEAGYTNAIECYNQALKADPNFALAYCGLADTYGWMGGWQLSGKEAWGKGKELAQKALALDPDLAEAHLSLGIALASAFDWQGGEKEMKRALELNPKLALAYDQIAWQQAMFGRFDEAARQEQKAIALDPLSVMFNSGLGWQLWRARRYDEAILQARKTLELDPQFADAHELLGWCLFWKGDTAGAIAEFKKVTELDPQPLYAAALGYAYAAAGERAKAAQILRDVEDQTTRRYVSPASGIYLQLGLGDKAKALDWLEKCYAEQDEICWSLKFNPLFDSLRPEPRFQSVLRSVFPEP